MKKTIIIISSILLVAFVAGNVFAWGHGRGGGMMGAGFNQDCPRYGGGQSGISDLSKDQRDELAALRQQFIDETYEFRSAKFAKQQEMRMLMETSDPDRDKLSKLSKELTDLQKQVRDKGIDFRLNAKKIAPELGRGGGFGHGFGKGSGYGGHRGSHGEGMGYHGGGRYYNN
jgi:zinc resistance-associated protein